MRIDFEQYWDAPGAGGGNKNVNSLTQKGVPEKTAIEMVEEKKPNPKAVPITKAEQVNRRG